MIPGVPSPRWQLSPSWRRHCSIICWASYGGRAPVVPASGGCMAAEGGVLC